MSRRTTYLVMAVLAAVLLSSCFMLIQENSKSMENLPALEEILEMDPGKANARVSGYLEHQLLDAWGKPDRSDTETLVWRLPEGVVTVQADTKGKIVSCGSRHMKDLPGLRDAALMNLEELTARVLGQYADHLASVWNRPDQVSDQRFTWRLPPNSPHEKVTVKVNQWGMIENAEFTD